MAFPISESELQKTETKLGARFPEAYRRAMMLNNGGDIVTAEDEWEFHPILDSSDRKRLSRSSNDVLRETEQDRKWRDYPPGGLSIAGNGFGDVMLFIRSTSDPTKFEDAVFTYWHETNELKMLAKDFSELKATEA